MIRLSLRLTLNGGREAAVRLVITALAVALGVGLLLTTLAGINAVNTQNGRYAWLETGFTSGPPPAPGASSVLWRITADEFRGTEIARVDVAAVKPGSPVPPGIAHLPKPGDFYASPALSRLLHSAPAAQLRDRYGTRQIGTIGVAGLPAPGSLLVVTGLTVHAINKPPGAVRTSSIATTAPSSCDGCPIDVGVDANGIDLILGVVAIALLFPVLIFIGSATRLSAARREQRFAAMRLVGATPRQISLIAAVESSVGAITGVVLGFGLFAVFRPELAKIPFTGSPFFTSDLAVNLPDVLAVALGVPLAAALAARLALRRVTISPLGVTRRVTPSAPRAWRLVPLLAGIAELGFFAKVGRPDGSNRQVMAYLGGMLLIVAGLVIAGPWLTMIGSRLMHRRTNRPAVLIAGRRLADNPQAGFRAISGLVLALFVTSVAVGVITTIVAFKGAPVGGAAAQEVLAQQYFRDPLSGPVPSIRALPAGLVGKVRAIPGVRGVAVIHTQPATPLHAFAPGVVSCADLAAVPYLGSCPHGASAVKIEPNLSGEASQAGVVWPSVAISPAQLATLRVQDLVVRTDGSSAAIERARTVLELAVPDRFSPNTIGEFRAQGSRLIDQYQQLANVVILTSLPIAGCSLAV
ncbi:MAG TPA: FtsX-like permease family protein, partial [Jatrophihabitantaceae bacterium]|nr:FtsX-like permease family protein [Jatrophihabitantaceae bacterium]